MKMEKTEFGNKMDFIGPYNYNNVFVVIKIDVSEQYMYNSNDAIIISSNKVSKARNHMVLLNKTAKIHNVL